MVACIYTEDWNIFYSSASLSKLDWESYHDLEDPLMAIEWFQQKGHLQIKTKNNNKESHDCKIKPNIKPKEIGYDNLLQ